LPGIDSSAITYSNNTGLRLSAPYTNTSNSKTISASTDVDVGYKGGNDMYMPLILRASADKYEVFDKTGTVIYTKNASDISDWASWKINPGFKTVAIANAGFVLFALYNKALSDAQVLDLVEYVNSLEVS
jgi:hypothetical protein